MALLNLLTVILFVWGILIMLNKLGSPSQVN
jgi:hypothetical protein